MVLVRKKKKRSKCRMVFAIASKLAKFKSNYSYWGDYFGYPKCCIESFKTNNCVEGELTFYQELVMDLGFIPCDFHARQILSKKITLEDLIKKRKHFEAFPKDSDIYKEF